MEWGELLRWLLKCKALMDWLTLLQDAKLIRVLLPSALPQPSIWVTYRITRFTDQPKFIESLEPLCIQCHAFIADGWEGLLLRSSIFNSFVQSLTPNTQSLPSIAHTTRHFWNKDKKKKKKKKKIIDSIPAIILSQILGAFFLILGEVKQR
jgi:hypothetical protein